jgi:hypothetical protein
MLIATFNNISDISRRSALLLEEIGITGEIYHRPVAGHWQTLSHNVVSSTSWHGKDSNSKFKWWLTLIRQTVVNSTTIQSRPRRLRISNSNADKNNKKIAFASTQGDHTLFVNHKYKWQYKEKNSRASECLFIDYFP